MAFGRFPRAALAKPFSDINVTPLVDVMLVLLVIFILTAPLLTLNSACRARVLLHTHLAAEDLSKPMTLLGWPAGKQALVLTAAGLAVAIPAVLAYNVLGRTVAQIEIELEGFAQDLMNLLTGRHN